LEVAVHGEHSLREAPVDVRAHDALAGEFPAVPDHIIDSVLNAYRRIGLDVTETLACSRRRLRDACAT
jgi:hypothetical protein